MFYIVTSLLNVKFDTNLKVMAFSQIGTKHFTYSTKVDKHKSQVCILIMGKFNDVFHVLLKIILPCKVQNKIEH